tara:strand:+ start:54 stop:869 length:816 start_codon:yes stop_codon:yes gene_type:complete
MFDELLKKNLTVDFKKESNCFTFEIPNFLSDNQYELLKQNFPKIDVNKAAELNTSFNDINLDNEHKRKAWITELNKESFSNYIISNKVLNEFVETIKNPLFTKFLMNKFYFHILKSRIFNPKSLLKLLLRKSRALKKRDKLYEKFLYNEIFTTVEWAYLFDGAESWPHTDGKKKILSLLLYFPDDNLTNNQIDNLGTTFFASNEYNFDTQKIKTQKEADDFRTRHKSFTLPFKKKSLFGFIKSHKSWHSVEKINIEEKFVRKNININLLLV